MVSNEQEAQQVVIRHIGGFAWPTLLLLLSNVAMKCVYCVPARTEFARAAGATEEEIKTAVAIAADVALNSSMLYGNQFDMEIFMKMFE